MSEADPEPGHRRRPRYRGTHPRRFEQKYKELSPEQYPELVEHVRERGMTPAGQHVSILVDEVLEVLAPRAGERGVDCTLGYGGHAKRLLERLAPGGTLLGLDVDPLELAKTEARLRALGHGADALVVRRTNFAGLGAAVSGQGWHDGVDFVFADLGVSSMQIDDPARGFTFKADGPLDMRMHPGKGLSAAEWLTRASVGELERILVEHSDEPHAERIAHVLFVRCHELTTTRALADAVRGSLPPRLEEEEVSSSIRRVFQALRIQVNDELGALEALLRQLPACVRPGGRVALLTFHSGEDRRVKHAFAAGLRDGVWSEVNDEVVRASAEERRANPRSAPAKLRWARRALATPSD